MADPSFFSGSDEESAINDIISQAMDHCVLEQVASINCSGVSDSVLPSELETRFHRLKSFPATNPKNKTLTKTKTHVPSIKPEESEEKFESLNLNQNINKPKSPSPSPSPPGEEIDPQTEKKNELKKNSEGAKSRPCCDGNGSRHRLRTGYLSSSSSSSSESSVEAPAPRQACCFWVSPKKVQRKTKTKKKKINKNKGTETRVSGIGLDPLDWDQNEEYLTSLKSFSLKEQRRKLKKALKEEEEINREAEKIVEWAKQASSRIDVSAIDELLSDEDKSD